MKNRIKAFSGGMLQVLLVVTSTTIIASHSPVWAVMVVAFFLNWSWTHNTRRVALGDEWDRISYGLGGSVGAGIGYLCGGLLAHFIN